MNRGRTVEKIKLVFNAISCSNLCFGCGLTYARDARTRRDRAVRGRAGGRWLWSVAGLSRRGRDRAVGG